MIPALATAAYAFARIGGLLAILPVMSAQGVPRSVPVLLSLILTALIAPSLVVVDQPPGLAAFALGLAGDMLLGFILGAGVAATFASLAFAAEIIAHQASLSAAMMFDPVAHTQEGPIGILASWLAGAVFIGAGGHLRAVEIVAASFQVIPAGQAAVPQGAVPDLVQAVAAAFALGIQLAGPVVAFVWLVNLFVALLARLAPRMNAFFAVGTTLTSVAAVGVTILALPWVLPVHAEAVLAAVARLLGGG